MKKNYYKSEQQITDYLTPLLEIASATWALIRTNEIRAVDSVKFVHPVLDVRCGNGTVAKVILSRRKDTFDVGIDLSPSEIAYAKKSCVYKKVMVENVYDLPFKAKTFETVFSNSVIEHIPDLDKTLTESSRVLKKNGLFIITVPTSYLKEYLFGYRFFNSLGMIPLAVHYGKFFNSVFKYKNLLTHKQWEKLLEKYNLKMDVSLVKNGTNARIARVSCSAVFYFKSFFWLLGGVSINQKSNNCTMAYQTALSVLS